MMGLGPKQGNLSLVLDYFSLMLGKLLIRLNNLKSSLRFLCHGISPIKDSISLIFLPRYVMRPITVSDYTIIPSLMQIHEIMSKHKVKNVLDPKIGHTELQLL